MLKELRIRNFAIIEALELACGEGLQVLTGETGAGKSIIVDALGLLSGWRATPDVIRSGSDEAVLEARIEPPDIDDANQRLAAVGVDPLPESAILLRRVIARGDRSRVSINGQMATVSQLAQLCAGLINIHGQHDHYALLSPAEQLVLLDRYGFHQPLRDAYQALYAQFHALEQERRALESLEQTSTQRAELLAFQLKELDGAGLHPGEEEALAEEQGRLRHSAQLAEAAEESYQLLHGSEVSLASQTAHVKKLAAQIAEIDGSMEPAAAMLDTVAIQLQELARVMRDYREGLVHDPARLAEVEDRQALIARLKKKHGAAELAALSARTAEIREELGRLEHREERLAAVTVRAGEVAAQLERCADELSRARRSSAERFCRQIDEELAHVRMAQASCTIECTPLGAPNFHADGWDRVEFLVRTNRGEELKPLRKVASGGELSRLMLSIMSVLGNADRVPVLVFDEVDAGIGGAVAELVGRRLQSLAHGRQLFCITHLPQIAAFADGHYIVEKTTRKGRAVTTVQRLSQDEQVAELARMVGGTAVTAVTRRHAKELFAAGQSGSRRARSGRRAEGSTRPAARE